MDAEQAEAHEAMYKWAAAQADPDAAKALAEETTTLLERAREEASDAQLRRIQRRVDNMPTLSVEHVKAFNKHVRSIMGW